MKMFISGPMSHIENYNCEAFNEMEELLKELGWSVFNPAWLQFDETWSRNEIMSIDIAALSRCDAIVMLKGWQCSFGANAEYRYAVGTAITVYTEEEIWQQVKKMREGRKE